MVLDSHVHVAAFGPPGNADGFTSQRLLNTFAFRFMRWRMGMVGSDSRTQQQVERTLAASLDATPELDGIVVLAFDGVYRDDGSFDVPRTHLYVSNDYVMRLCGSHRKFLFGASVNPLRKDAIAELERCVAAGAVLLKWLPIVQGFNPADPRCIPFYEALAHHKLPLLSHTGGEQSLIRLNDEYADPRLLMPALQHGVTVIAAHCGTRARPFERDYFDTFAAMLREYPNLYGDTAALNLPMRAHAFPKILADPLVRQRVIHGSDWPILPLPPMRVGMTAMLELMEERNWLRRDLLIKQRLGFDSEYWQRGDRLLRISERNMLPAGPG